MILHHAGAAALVATHFLPSVAAESLPTVFDSASLSPRRVIPRPGRIPDSFTPDPPQYAPPPRLGGPPKDSPDGNTPLLPKRPVGKGDDPDAPSGNERDPYIPPEAPDLSSAPSTRLNQAQDGKAGDTYHPCSPRRYDDNLCLELISVGSDIVQELFGPDPEDDSSSSAIGAPDTEPTTTSTSLLRFNDFAVETSAPAMPNVNMSLWMAGGKYVDVYTPDEFDRLKDDPLCFFAAYERIYRAYASLGLSSSTTRSSSAPAPTSGDLSRRQIGCHNAPELCKDPEDKARTLYLGYLPDQIHLVYKHTPTEVTVKETGTTSCEGFTLEDQVTIEAFETTYGVFEYKEGEEPPAETTGRPTGPDEGLVEDKAGRGEPLGLLVVIAWVMVMVAFGDLA